MIHKSKSLQVFKRFGEKTLMLDTDFQMMACKDSVLSVLIVDRSGSMRQFGLLPQVEVNNHIKRMSLETGAEHYVLVVTFADRPTVDINVTRCKNNPQLVGYVADGETLLFDTVYYVLKALYNLRKTIPMPLLENLQVVVGVFSDGANNPPQGYANRDQPRKLQDACKVVLATGKFDLNSYGIGIDAKQLATSMGFPTDDVHCVTVHNSEDGVTAASGIFSQRTSTFSIKMGIEDD
ncbi:TPA: hypothetical protein DF272_06720 [Candidatus Falkowbacteria bacterium]|nr:hypothetical protein [Candidatus Falkowbacteria bacterium]